jgi:quinoprotein dehydrogenase-associated probable ABC transporter substrate-binding protein
VSPIYLRIVTALAICLPLAAPVAEAKTPFHRDSNTEFEDLTPGEKIAIRAAAKVAYKNKKGGTLTVCADAGNMPLSNEKLEGYENKLAKIVADAMGAELRFSWRPSLERGLTRQTFDQDQCDMMVGMPANYADLLTTDPIFRTTYVLAYRPDSGLDIKSLDDPKLKDLKIGAYQVSGIREALAKRGISRLYLKMRSHNADLVPENQPWVLVQDVVDKKLDVAAIWGPFAGWFNTMKGTPVTIVPVNLMEDRIPLEFSLAIGVNKTDAMLKYMIEFALDDKKEEVEKLLREFGVPLVNCSNCLVQGDLPSHGSYTAPLFTEFKAHPELLQPDQVVTMQKLENWLADGADANVELANAVLARSPERVKFLVGKGADVNKPDGQGWSPLAAATRDRSLDIMKLLLELKADVDSPGPGGTPLVIAVNQNNVPAMKLLIENGADINRLSSDKITPLAMAIVDGRYEAALALIEAGADLDMTVGPQAVTPLMIAASQTKPGPGAIFLPSSARPVDVARSLIKHGADVNARSKAAMTPLMVAAVNNNSPMIGLLMEAGADPNAKNDEGKTARDIAERLGNLEASQAILVLSSSVASKEPSAQGASSNGSSSQ